MRPQLSRIRALFRHRVLDERLDEEVQMHLDALAEELVRRAPHRPKRVSLQDAHSVVSSR